MCYDTFINQIKIHFALTTQNIGLNFTKHSWKGLLLHKYLIAGSWN